MYARCPECKRTRLLVKTGTKDVRIVFRVHHEPWPNVEFHHRHKNPVCRGSGRLLALGASLSKL